MESAMRRVVAKVKVKVNGEDESEEIYSSESLSMFTCVKHNFYAETQPLRKILALHKCELLRDKI